MSPTPHAVDPPSSRHGSEILITGISGRFPKSSSVKEFQDNLYNKVSIRYQLGMQHLSIASEFVDDVKLSSTDLFTF